MNSLATILQFAAAHAVVLGLALVSLASLIAIAANELRPKLTFSTGPIPSDPAEEI